MIKDLSREHNDLLNQLLNHVRHDEATCFPICTMDRFPVKLLVSKDERSRSFDVQSPVTTSSAFTTLSLKSSNKILALENAKLREELQRVNNKKEEDRKAREALRKAADDATVESEKASERNKELQHENQLLRQKRDQYHQLLEKQERGYTATISEKDRALDNYRKHGSLEGLARLREAYDEAKNRLMRTEDQLREREVELRAANERINILGQLDARLTSAKGLCQIFEAEKRIDDEHGTRELETLQRNHDEAVRQLREKQATEFSVMERQMEELQLQASFRAETREQSDARTADLQKELSALKKSMEAQERLHAQHEHSLDEEINRLRAEVQRLQGTVKTLKDPLEKVVPIFKVQEANFRRRENELTSQINEMNGSKKRRRNKRDKAPNNVQETPVIAKRRKAAPDGTSMTEPSQSQSQASSDTSSVLPRPTKQRATSRPRQQAVAEQGIARRGPATASAGRLKDSGTEKVIIGDPYEADSDEADSD